LTNASGIAIAADLTDGEAIRINKEPPEETVVWAPVAGSSFTCTPAEPTF
jgi:hypothetical protein